VPAISSNDVGSCQTAEEVITPLMNELLMFRDKVKANAGDKGAIYKFSDEIRDERLPELGIRLEDRGNNQGAFWKFENKEVLRQERLKKNAEKE